MRNITDCPITECSNSLSKRNSGICLLRGLLNIKYILVFTSIYVCLAIFPFTRSEQVKLHLSRKFHKRWTLERKIIGFLSYINTLLYTQNALISVVWSWNLFQFLPLRPASSTCHTAWKNHLPSYFIAGAPGQTYQHSLFKLHWKCRKFWRNGPHCAIAVNHSLRTGNVFDCNETVGQRTFQ